MQKQTFSAEALGNEYATGVSRPAVLTTKAFLPHQRVTTEGKEMGSALEKLAVQQYQLTAEIRRLKKLSGNQVDNCMNTGEGPLESKVRGKVCNCHVEAARDDFEALKPKSFEDEHYTFEELLLEYCCEHCTEWHRIQRKQILPLKLKLRSVRAAITKIGKNLEAA
ncbi:hypothetical protein [Enterobacter hormaechei]|uniref:hypothetical protein n=2 Tax=Enterobacter cloacae complex TaxID=354276 RepID=UPI00403AA21C